MHRNGPHQIVFTHAGDGSDQRNSRTRENVRVANARPFQNLWRSKSTRREDDLLFCFDDPRSHLLTHIGLEVSTRPEGHTHSPFVLVKDNVLNIRLDQDVEVGELSTVELRVDIRMSGILPCPIGADEALSAHGAVDGVQSVVVGKLWPAHFPDCRYKIIFQGIVTIVAGADYLIQQAFSSVFYGISTLAPKNKRKSLTIHRAFMPMSVFRARRAII